MTVPSSVVAAIAGTGHIHRSPAHHRHIRAKRAVTRRRLKQLRSVSTPLRWWQLYQTVANHHSKPFHDFSRIFAVSSNGVQMPQKWSCSCGSSVPITMSYCGSCGRRWDKVKQVQPAKNRSRSSGSFHNISGSNSIRRRVFSPSRRCTVASFAALAAIFFLRFACTSIPACRPSIRQSAEVVQNASAPTSQSYWQGGEPYRTFGKSIGRNKGNLAEICPRHATVPTKGIPQVLGFSARGQCRIGATEDRIARSVDSAFGTDMQYISGSTTTSSSTHDASGSDDTRTFAFALHDAATDEHASTIHGSRRIATTGTAAFSTAAGFCFAQCSGRYSAISASASFASCKSSSAYTGASPRPNTVASTTDIWTSTTATASWQLGMATWTPQFASICSHGIPAATSNLARSCVNIHARAYCRTTSYAKRFWCSHCKLRYDASRECRPTAEFTGWINRPRFLAHIGASSRRSQRPANISGWCGRDGFKCLAHSAVGSFCKSAETMPRANATIPIRHASPCSGSISPNRSANCRKSGSPPSRTWSTANARSPASSCATDASSVQRHHVYPQLARRLHSCAEERRGTTFPDVATWPKTAEDTQAHARQHSQPEHRCGCSDTFIRQQPCPIACPDRSSHRNRRRTSGTTAVGIESCGGPDGSQVPIAVDDRANLPRESPKPLTSTHQSGVQILDLDSLLPVEPRLHGIHSSQGLFGLLCQCWPDTAMLWGHSFVDELPDLDPSIRALVKSSPCWNHEHVVAVHLYIDGSSYQNRQHPDHIQAAWAFIVVLTCQVQGNECCRMYGATSHQLSSSDMDCNQFHGVGELTSDPLSAEAVGMIVCLAWVAQSPFECQHFVHYDNATVGQFASGRASWNADWEHSYLRTNLAAIRHCFQMRPRPPLYEHVKAHEGHPMNECADALAKATAKGLFLNQPIPCVVSKVMLNRGFPYAWMALAPKDQVPLPYALPGLFKAEGPFCQEHSDTTWQPMEFECNTQDVSINIVAATAKCFDTGTWSEDSAMSRFNAKRAH